MEKLLPEEKFTKFLKNVDSSLLQLLQNNKREILEPINTRIISKVAEIDLIKVLDNEKNQLENFMVKLAVNLEKEIISKYSENTLDEFIELSK